MEDIANYPLMLDNIKTVLTEEDFAPVCKSKATAVDAIKINRNTPDAFRKLIHLLHQNKITYHTYQPRQEKSYKAVIKNEKERKMRKMHNSCRSRAR